MVRPGIFSRFCIFIFLLFLIASCREERSEPGPKYGVDGVPANIKTYRFAVHPLHNPEKLSQVYQPLMDYLNHRTAKVRFVLESSRDYAHFESKITDGDIEFLLPNPWQTLQAIQKGYTVIAMAGDAEDFKGIIIARIDSLLQKPADLKGKIVSYPSPTALAACIMPQFFLHTHGINVNTEIVNRYVGSQESSIMNVFLKQSDAGATWPPPWRAFQKDHPEEAKQLKVIWETPSLMNNSVMAKKDLPRQFIARVRDELTMMHESEEGRHILAAMETSRFFSKTDNDYTVVQNYIEIFEKEVRPVKQ